MKVYKFIGTVILCGTICCLSSCSKSTPVASGSATSNTSHQETRFLTLDDWTQDAIGAYSKKFIDPFQLAGSGLSFVYGVIVYQLNNFGNYHRIFDGQSYAEGILGVIFNNNDLIITYRTSTNKRPSSPLSLKVVLLKG